MARILSIFIILAQCAIGHANNNRGGAGEIQFTEVWRNLGKILEPVAHESEVAEALEKQKKLPHLKFDPTIERQFNVNEESGTVTIAPKALYTYYGQAFDRTSMVGLALSVLFSCEARVVGGTPDQLAQRAMSYLAHISLPAPDGKGIWEISHRRIDRVDTLQLATSWRRHDLTAIFAQKLKVDVRALSFEGISVRGGRRSVVITGEVFVLHDGIQTQRFSLAVRPQPDSREARFHLVVF